MSQSTALTQGCRNTTEITTSESNLVSIKYVAKCGIYFIDPFRQWRKKPQAWIHIDPPDGLFKKDEWGQASLNLAEYLVSW